MYREEYSYITCILLKELNCTELVTNVSVFHFDDNQFNLVAVMSITSFFHLVDYKTFVYSHYCKIFLYRFSVYKSCVDGYFGLKY